VASRGLNRKGEGVTGIKWQRNERGKSRGQLIKRPERRTANEKGRRGRVMSA